MYPNIYLFILQSVETQTYPPPRATFSATALQSIIYDFYQKDYESKESEREGEKPKKVPDFCIKFLKWVVFLNLKNLKEKWRSAN